MSVSRRNAEGYFDPTAYAAMVRVEQEARQQKGFSKKKTGRGKMPQEQEVEATCAFQRN